jgi:hypothetical protein
MDRILLQLHAMRVLLQIVEQHYGLQPDTRGGGYATHQYVSTYFPLSCLPSPLALLLPVLPQNALGVHRWYLVIGMLANTNRGTRIHGVAFTMSTTYIWILASQSSAPNL